MNRTRSKRSAQAEFIEAAKNFWFFVTLAEQDILEHSHAGRLPPYCFDEPPEQAFLDAYDCIARYLKRFEKERSYDVPPGLRFRPSPIFAVTAHQGLMHFLNRSDQLHGEPGVLDSPEYKRLKELAWNELRQMEVARGVRANEKALSRGTRVRSGPRGDGELTRIAEILLAHLWKHHGCDTGEPVYTPWCSQAEMAKLLDCSQSTASKAMKELMRDVRRFSKIRPMTRYVKLCESREIIRELLEIRAKPLEKTYRRLNSVEDMDRFADPDSL